MRTSSILLCFALVVSSLTVEAASTFHRDNLALERRNAKLYKHRKVVADDNKKEALAKDAFSLRGGGEKSKGGTASMTAMIFNLVNNVAGTPTTRQLLI